METPKVIEIKEEDVIEEWKITTLRVVEDVLDILNSQILREAARKAMQ